MTHLDVKGWLAAGRIQSLYSYGLYIYVLEAQGWLAAGLCQSLYGYGLYIYVLEAKGWLAAGRSQSLYSYGLCIYGLDAKGWLAAGRSQSARRHRGVAVSRLQHCCQPCFMLLPRLAAWALLHLFLAFEYGGDASSGQMAPMKVCGCKDVCGSARNSSSKSKMNLYSSRSAEGLPSDCRDRWKTCTCDDATVCTAVPRDGGAPVRDASRDGSRDR